MATPVARVTGLPASRRTSQKKLFSYEPPNGAYRSQRQGAGVGFKARGNRSTLDNAEHWGISKLMESILTLFLLVWQRQLLCRHLETTARLDVQKARSS